MRRWMLLPVCLGLIACSDDATAPPDTGGDTGSADTAGMDAPPADTLTPDRGSESGVDAPLPDGPTADGPAADKTGGPCKSWSQWSCALPGSDQCRASCTLSGVPLQLECSNKGGKADCECKKSGVKTNCAYSGPVPKSCDVCRAAFLSGCCNPP